MSNDEAQRHDTDKHHQHTLKTWLTVMIEALGSLTEFIPLTICSNLQVRVMRPHPPPCRNTNQLITA